MNAKTSSFLLLLVAMFPFILAGQINYYVSPSGNNSNPGTMSQPFEKIQHAIVRMGAGDTLNIMAGTYLEKVNVIRSGNPGQKTVLRNYANDTVYIDGSAQHNSIALMSMFDRHDIRIEGINFRNNYNLNGEGVIVEGAGSGFEFVNNTFSNIAISSDPNFPVTDTSNMPVLTFLGTNATDSLSNILISGNEVFNCRPGYSECISFWGNVSGIEISGNTVHDNANIGIGGGGNYGDCATAALDHGRNGVIKNNICYNNIAAYSPSGGIYMDGAQNMVVENNLCYHNGYGIEVGCEKAGKCSNITVRNNVLYNNIQAGMALGGYDANTGGLVENSTITNNTFYFNDAMNDGNGEILFSQFENGKLSNNIFYLSAQNVLMGNDRNQPNLSMNYNLVYNDAGAANISAEWNGNTITGLANVYTTVSIGSNDTYGKPQFITPGISNPDFHIANNSPAINAGNPAFTAGNGEVDLDGQARVLNGRVDCGADEFMGVIGLVEEVEASVSVFPNPVIDQITLRNDGQKLVSYEILNFEGKTIKTGKILKNKIDCAELPAGVYLLNLKGKGQHSVNCFRFIRN